MIELGIYTHFKGGSYRVVALAVDASIEATDSATTVIYENLQAGNEGLLFTRPVEEFTAQVNGAPRFKYQGKISRSTTENQEDVNK